MYRSKSCQKMMIKQIKSLRTQSYSHQNFTLSVGQSFLLRRELLYVVYDSVNEKLSCTKAMFYVCVHMLTYVFISQVGTASASFLDGLDCTLKVKPSRLHVTTPTPHFISKEEALPISMMFYLLAYLVRSSFPVSLCLRAYLV